MKVSIIIPAWNRSQLTVKAVKSALNQTHKDVEVIVVDDGSTDDTYQQLIPYDIRYIYQPHHGASAARNKGIVKSTGDYIAFLDCDDMFLPEKIEVCLRAKKDFVYNSVFVIDKHDTIIKLYRPKKVNLLFRNSICSSVVIKKECIDKVGLFDEKLFVAADWDLWLRIQEHYDLHYIDRPLSYYRSDPPFMGMSQYIYKHPLEAWTDEFRTLIKAFQRRNVKPITRWALLKKAWLTYTYREWRLRGKILEQFKQSRTESLLNNSKT